MFDFNKYNLGELVAISDMLEYIEHGVCVDYQQEKCREAINEHLEAQAMAKVRLSSVYGSCVTVDHAAAEAEKVDRIVQACIAGAPPAIQCSNIDKCGVCLTECPMLEEDLH